MPAKGDNVSADSNGNGKHRKLSIVPEETLPALEADLPASRKQFLEDGEIRVPVREIEIGGGNPPLQVYDTTGPQGHDVRTGLPPLRRPWIERRLARGDTNLSQMHCARRGEIT